MNLQRAVNVIFVFVFVLCISSGVKISEDIPGMGILPKNVRPDMIDEKGTVWLNRNDQADALLSGFGPNDKRIWDEEVFKDNMITKNENRKPPPKDDNKMRADKQNKIGLCNVLKSGVLECDGTTQEDAAAAARRHLASRPEPNTCPDESDECPASDAPSAQPEECQLGWLLLGDFCYDAAYRMRASQRTAREYCRADGGHLINPISHREAEYFLQFFPDFWVGAEYSASAQRWQWLSGDPLPTNVSLLGGPAPEPKRRCVRLHTVKGQQSVSFVKSGCGVQYAFVCRATLDELVKHSRTVMTTAPVAPALARDHCPPRWRLIAGWCHLIPRLIGDWANGELWCNHHHDSKLVTLRSRKHELGVDALVGHANASYHIGMRYRRATSTWGWMSGNKAQYRNWRFGHAPTWVGGKKDVTCGYRRTQKDYWAATGCAAERYFVCGFELFDEPADVEDPPNTDGEDAIVNEKRESEAPENNRQEMKSDASEELRAADEDGVEDEEQENIESAYDDESTKGAEASHLTYVPTATKQSSTDENTQMENEMWSSEDSETCPQHGEDAGDAPEGNARRFAEPRRADDKAKSACN